MELLSPPIAFLLNIPLVLIIVWFGRQLAAPAENPSAAKSSLYGAGEEAPLMVSAPGYRPFFLVAFFFAILHLGMLVLGFGDLSWPQGVYILGLALALVALILG
jgi:hypothetical protein